MIREKICLKVEKLVILLTYGLSVRKKLTNGLLFLVEINRLIASTAKNHFVRVSWTDTARQALQANVKANESE